MTEFKVGRVLLSRLDHGEEMVAQIVDLAEKNDIRTGVFTIIGALCRAELAFYDQAAHRYQTIKVDRPAEIVSCIGNISMRDERPFVHAHATLSDSLGNVVGGHLSSGTVFAAEIFLQELSGEPLIRRHDPITDLYLWSNS
ncbi:MAG: DNA-binding protein [Methanotrichaceae archaeon]|nr:DNA-binding protein [Methanotrichaceae archaeon]